MAITLERSLILALEGKHNIYHGQIGTNKQSAIDAGYGVRVAKNIVMLTANGYQWLSENGYLDYWEQWADTQSKAQPQEAPHPTEATHCETCQSRLLRDGTCGICGQASQSKAQPQEAPQQKCSICGDACGETLCKYCKSDESWNAGIIPATTWMYSNSYGLRQKPQNQRKQAKSRDLRPQKARRPKNMQKGGTIAFSPPQNNNHRMRAKMKSQSSRYAQLAAKLVSIADLGEAFRQRYKEKKVA